jgi:hypothetical protein
MMRTTQLHKQGTDDDIGIAWHLRNVGPLRVAAHGGTLAGHILLLELVPEKNFAIGILTNSTNGWRLIQDVEREVLRSYRRLPEELRHRASDWSRRCRCRVMSQPDPALYLGRHLRPMNAYRSGPGAS